MASNSLVPSAVAAGLASLLLSQGIWARIPVFSDSLGRAAEGASPAIEPADRPVFVDGSCTDPTCQTLTRAGRAATKVEASREPRMATSPLISQSAAAGENGARLCDIKNVVTSSPTVLGFSAVGNMVFGHTASRMAFGVIHGAARLAWKRCGVQSVTVGGHLLRSSTSRRADEFARRGVELHCVDAVDVRRNGNRSEGRRRRAPRCRGSGSHLPLTASGRGQPKRLKASTSQKITPNPPRSILREARTWSGEPS